ncbi:hypothetical protein [Kluyvera intermedia]|uniref:hypothetical protein n=1 Tax=Kluyvera intermedia TaxID=61648 RepID=UPI003BA165BB
MSGFFVFQISGGDRMAVQFLLYANLARKKTRHVAGSFYNQGKEFCPLDDGCGGAGMTMPGVTI